MRALISIIFVYLVVNSLGLMTIKENQTIEPCHLTRLVVAVNLVDEECLLKSGSKSNDTSENENNIEVTDVEMDSYALCLLKKSSVMNKQGEVNVNFDITKIIKHLYKRMDARGLGLAFIIKSLERCRNLTGSDQLSTATKIMKCLLENQETVVWCDPTKS